MKDTYFSYENDDLWMIKETEWTRNLQGIRETQFALGNGYLGVRGVLEGIPYDAMPGTYMAGIYDKMTAQVSELINLPNSFNFKFTVEGEKLDLVAMNNTSHRRSLNMKKGVLVRHTSYRDSKKRQYDYSSIRFVSMHNKNIGVMQITLTPKDAECVLDINTGIDTSISNAGVLTEGRKRHFRVKELGQSEDAGYVAVDTLEKKYTVIYWSGFYYEINGKKVFAKDNIFQLKLKKNQTVVFTKIFCMKHFSYKENVAFCKKDAFKIFNKAFRQGFSALIKDHVISWDKLWTKADIVIGGTANLQQNLRFNIYHMLICGHFDKGFSSIGARTLSGEGYRGHIFWDSEIFLLPFYLFTFPRVAKNMLLYRYRCLDKARDLAKREMYKGAKFAWESGDTGEEETPEWARDIDGSIIKIHTHQFEHHITADVAYAVYKYYVATGDEQFMDICGYEMMFETARFWTSRAEYNKRKKKYEIKNIIGPDEFHINIDNNVFTNMMAKRNLITAYKLYHEAKRKSPTFKKLKSRLNLNDKEVKQWRMVASDIVSNITKDKVIEQFEGYFKLKKVNLTKTDENGILLLPRTVKPKDLGKTQIVKQADVLMLLCLLDDVFNIKTKIVNYNFYISRTIHTSSLSMPSHSLIASEVGDINRAYSFFNVSLRADISNLYGNTKEGIHAASLGGTWQAVVFGFGGVKVKKEKLFISPRMPRSWGKMVFSLSWKGDMVKLEITNNLIKIKVVSSQQKTVEIGIFDKLTQIKTNKAYSFKKSVCVDRDKFYSYCL
ncbi:MAG: glycosyl hydrolase family 65 protein [Candidatus Omnitrophota bacterium]